MRISVVGAGGLGSYLGAALLDGGHDVTLVARGDHLEAMQARGLRIVASGGARTLHPRAVAALDPRAAPDIAFVTAKSHGLDGVGPSLAGVARAGTVVVPLTNGVDAAERLEKAGVEGAQLVTGVAYVTAFTTEPGVVRRKGEHGKLLLGATAPAASTGVSLVARALADTELDVEVRDDIQGELWCKMAVVCALVSGCALTRSDLGAVRSHPLGRSLLSGAVEEVAAVAASREVPFSEEDRTRIEELLFEGFPDAFHPSLIHDLRTGRRTEIEALNGTIVRYGAQVALPTPIATATVCAVDLWNGGPDRFGAGL